MKTHITCPDCGQRVAISAIIETHDGAPPCRALCSASGAGTNIVAAAIEAAVTAASTAAPRSVRGRDRDRRAHVIKRGRRAWDSRRLE